MVKQIMVAFETTDGKVFKSKLEAGYHEQNLIISQQSAILRTVIIDEANSRNIEHFQRNSVTTHLFIDMLLDDNWLLKKLISLGWEFKENTADINGLS